MVKKTNEKWKMCVGFMDLNKACPKDSYPLLRVNILVDSTARYQLLSFMDPVRTQNMAIGPNLNLGSQSICIVGFGFPIKGDSMLGSPGTLLFPQKLLFTSQNCYLS